MTWTGASLVSLVPSPSWPAELSPQASTVPSDLSAKLYEMPPFTMTISESGTRAASATGTQSATAKQIIANQEILIFIDILSPSGAYRIASTYTLEIVVEHILCDLLPEPCSVVT